MQKIGLVAGYGKLPLLYARAARAAGETVIGFGIKGMTDEALASNVDKMHWLTWGSLQKAILFAIMDGVRRAVLLGKIDKSVVFGADHVLDDDAKKVLSARGGKKDYTILREVEGHLKKIGISIIDPTPYLQELIPRRGVLTRRQPTEKEWSDIGYGKTLAAAMAHFDIGQTVAVREKTVIAVEAVEGTDETIRRAGSLIDGGFVVVKMARPDQDMRFDVPLVGLDTLKTLIASKCKVFALEADRTFLSDREEVVKLADDHDVAIAII